MVDHVDALVIGAGPAGAVAALTLAAHRRVAMVERDVGPRRRTGESLPAAARRLLGDMQMLESFERQGHLPCYGRRSVWGASQAVEFDSLSDPDGHGWLIDRAAFDGWLRDAAIARGVTLIAGTVRRIDRDGQHWTVDIDAGSTRPPMTAAVLIDASGRSSPIARQLGARRAVRDRLVCGWVHGWVATAGRGVGMTSIESERDGWWYAAMVPGGRAVLAFHTDADLPAARDVRNSESLMTRARRTTDLAAMLAECAFEPIADGGLVAAHSAALEPCAGDAWVAAGDAALAFDPISSQGLFNALYTGRSSAGAAERWLRGDHGGIADYHRTIAGILSAYGRHFADYYAMEDRWPEAVFWQRRRSAGRE